MYPIKDDAHCQYSAVDMQPSELSLTALTSCLRLSRRDGGR
ncbi:MULTISPECIES: hypothetical protein [Pseudomonas]|uniref:Uncharacterized protein n=1 Tax=Pseudomonas piscis TaxID=2614538 RepID=A0ABY9N8R6_9PSED|nr:MULTISPECIES: hypothetical protein [Pseudomonas]AZC18573.1 hypothetical protein C4K40_3185 [Pseudomonas sp. CMR5c]WMN14858.1 hypothetical protein QL104_15890 [Pseudomonas piscis]